MSTIGFSNSDAAIRRRPMLIGAHADYRPEDFSFARTQSIGLRAAKWQSRIKPLHSWSELVVFGAGLSMLLLVALRFA